MRAVALAALVLVGCNHSDVNFERRQAYMDGMNAVLWCDIKHVDSGEAAADCIKSKLDSFLQENK